MARRGTEGHQFPTHDFPQEHADLEYGAEFSAAEMALIRQGWLPEEMEDKWLVIWTEADATLRLYRSWTGFCTYEVTFKPGADAGTWLVATAKANRNREQYGETDARYDAMVLNFLIQGMLLGKRAPIPEYDSPLEAWATLGSAGIPAPADGSGAQPEERR